MARLGDESGTDDCINDVVVVTQRRERIDTTPTPAAYCFFFAASSMSPPKEMPERCSGIFLLIAGHSTRRMP